MILVGWYMHNKKKPLSTGPVGHDFCWCPGSISTGSIWEAERLVIGPEFLHVSYSKKRAFFCKNRHVCTVFLYIYMCVCVWLWKYVLGLQFDFFSMDLNLMKESVCPCRTWDKDLCPEANKHLGCLDYPPSIEWMWSVSLRTFQSHKQDLMT